jgi:hypothetical protein
MMLATLALGRHAITKPKDRHSVVILQETGPGPSALLLPFARAAIRRRFVCGSVITALLFAIVTLANFSLTLLLSDMQPANLFGETKSLAVNMTEGNFDMESVAMMGERPVAYPVFAERTEGRIDIGSTQQDRGLFDTGNTSRAYMPLSNIDRVRVRQYHGFGTVLTTHTICFPLDVSNITIVDLYRQGNLYHEPNLKGTILAQAQSLRLVGLSRPPCPHCTRIIMKAGHSISTDCSRAT